MRFLKEKFGFESADSLREHLASLGLESALPYFADLLRLPLESSDKKFNSLPIEQIQYRTFQYLRDWLIQLAKDAPVVWVVDDTHWLSPEGSRLLQYLCRTTRDSPVLFLFSRRKGYEQVAEAEHGIELEKQVAQRYPEVYQQIDLEPLEEWASLSLLYHFLGKQQLLPSKEARVLSLAAGNPFYLREVAQLLINAPGPLNVPPGVERLILAHLDMLPPVHQSLLRYASVFGSHVDGLLLQNAFPEIKPEAMCEQLRRIGWLQSATVGNALSGVFVWRHDLYRESIYNSIEPNVRRQLHAEIAQQLEIFPETPPDVLAEHYEAAGNPEKSAHYACLATAICHKQRRHLRVQRYAEMALSHLKMLSQEQHVEIRYQYAKALKETGHSSEAIPHLEQAFSIARANGQRILITLELSHCDREYAERVIALREKALSLIDEYTETSVIIDVCNALSGTDRASSPDVVQQVLRLAQKRKDHKAEVLVLRLLALAQAAAGNLDDAQSTIQHALQLAEALEDNELIAGIELGVARILWERARSLEALNHLYRALHLCEQMDKHSYYAWHFLLGEIYHDLEQYEAMTEAFEKVLERKEVFGDTSKVLGDTFAYLVQGYAYLGDWEKAYNYFWQMVDNMNPYPSDMSYVVENAIGALCHGDKTNRRWMWEGISQTMARAQELIRHLYEHGITLEDYEKRLKALHPILAAGYVEYGVKRSHEEGVAVMRLFARQVWIMDEHVEYWAYLSGTLDYDALEAIFEDALEQVEREEPILLNEKHNRPEFFVSAHPEKLILKWLRACLRERYETDDAGKHLRQMGMIPEPCWLITGTFEENVPAEVEQMILNIVFNRGKRDQMTLENRKASESDNLQSSTFNLQLDWQTTDDFRDGYIDCQHIFQTMDRVSAYACTVILSPKEQQVQFTIYHDDSIRVWLNGETCFEKDHCGYSLFDGVLKQGYNLVLIRLTNYEDGWGFILRVTDKADKVLEDLTYTQPCLSSGVALSRQLSCSVVVATEGRRYRQQDATGNPSLRSRAGLTQIPMELSYWAKAFSGNWEETAEGIKLYGTSYRGGNMIFSKSLYNFVNSQLFVKWMPYGGNGYNYAGFTNAINMICGIGGSTHHPYKERRPRLYDGTWYYTRIKVNADKTYTAVMSTGDYDINGGTVVKSDSGIISDEYWKYIERTNILVDFGDNYAGTSTYMIVAEVKTDATPVQTTILSMPIFYTLKKLRRC